MATNRYVGRKGMVPNRKCLLHKCWEKREVPWVAFCSEAHLDIYVKGAMAASRIPRGVGTSFVDGRVVVGG